MKQRRTVRTDRQHYDQTAPGVAPRSNLARGRSIPHRPHTADPGPTPLEAARTLLGRREEPPAKLSRTTIPKPFQQRPKAFVIQRSANQPRAHGFPCPKESPAPVTVVKKVRLATYAATHSQQWAKKEMAGQRREASSKSPGYPRPLQLSTRQGRKRVKPMEQHPRCRKPGLLPPSYFPRPKSARVCGRAVYASSKHGRISGPKLCPRSR